MRTIVNKLFWAWDFDKEEKWLNEMAAKGLALVGVGFCRYEFEDCVPGEYSYRLEFLNNKPNHPESRKYISFVEETGAEQVGSYLSWVYFRNKGEFELFSDYKSKISHLTKIIRLLWIFLILNLSASIYNISIAFGLESEVNYIGFINLALCLWIGYGVWSLTKKRKLLKNEQNIFE